MKYNININQKQAIDLKLSLNQAIILGLLATSQTWATPITHNNEIYYWVARQKIAEELPLLNLKTDTIYRHLKYLSENNFIEYIKLGKKDCIKILNKGKTYIHYVGNKSESKDSSEMNPNKLGNESEKNSEMNPTDNNTTSNNKTNVLEKSTKKDFVPEQKKESLKELENLSKSDIKELISLLNEKKKKNTTPAKKKSLSKLELKNGWQEVWHEYLEWKKTQYRFKFKTAKSEKIAFEKLFRLSGGNIQLAKKIVRQSIENTWSGLFALTQQNAKPQQQRYGDTRKDLRATGTEKRKDLR